MSREGARSSHGISYRGMCSGACPFFSAEYLRGRKVPGTGTCQNHDLDTPVTVGTPCLWVAAANRPVPLPLARPRRVPSTLAS